MRLVRTKTKRVYRLQCAVKVGRDKWLPAVRSYSTRKAATMAIKSLEEDEVYACFKLTGPFKQKVPAR